MGYKVSYMWKGLNNSDIIRCIAIFLFCLLSSKGMSQTGEETVNTLVGMGFENVGWHEDDKERVYVMENTAYRLNGVGIGKAIDVVQRMGLPQNKPCRLIFWTITFLRYHCIISQQLLIVFLRLIGKTGKLAMTLEKTGENRLKERKKNSSLFKVDITIYPELSLKNLVITQIYQVLFNLSPAIEVSLWKGMKLTAQMVIPIYNDGYPYLYGKVRPGFVGLSQSVRLPYNIWGTLTIGHFSNERYGVDLKVDHHCIWDERFTLSGRIGCTGAGYWEGFTMHYGTKKRITWSLGASFYWPQYNVETTMKVEQYLLGEKGVKLDIIRHFRYASIGFYAMKAEGVKANGGFRFQIALPPL